MKELAKLIDSTLVKAVATKSEIEKLTSFMRSVRREINTLEWSEKSLSGEEAVNIRRNERL